MLAGVVFVVVAAVAVAAYFVLSSEDNDPDASVSEVEDSSPAPAAPPKPAEPDADATPKTQRAVPSFDTIAWHTTDPTTLQDLVRVWSVPRDVLTKLNPELPLSKSLEVGTPVVVYSRSLGASASIGPPNDGRLIWGVPLPEDEAWTLPEDRTRAFATTETIASVVGGFHAYADRFPDAAPIVVGDLSARRGGRIYGHQSHQSGLDIDIRLVKDSTGEGFDAERNWFLAKALIDGSEVRAIFLNRTEQAWLRAAAEADVGAASAQEYFALIRHEPGHTIHMHVRFVCAKEDKRCVGYSLPDTDEKDPKKASKLPGGAGGTSRGGASKRPRLLPKGGGKTAGKKKKRKKKKAKKK
ncbi:MAG: penicillin-insensitive murein endopeptidase [Nannocystales bacterium]